MIRGAVSQWARGQAAVAHLVRPLKLVTGGVVVGYAKADHAPMRLHSQLWQAARHRVEEAVGLQKWGRLHERIQLTQGVAICSASCSQWSCPRSVL